MSIRDRSSHAAVNRDFRAVAMQQLEETDAEVRAILDQLAMRVPSGSSQVTYDWFGDIPTLREWKADRIVEALRADSLTVANKRYEATVGVNRDDIEDDNTGQGMIRIRNLVTRAARHRISLIKDIINDSLAAGGNFLAYDGKEFFADDHVNYSGGTAHDNLTTGALAEAAVQGAITLMNNLKTDRGESLDMNPTHLIFEPSKQWVARDILQQQRQSSGESNIMLGVLQPLMIKGLTAGYWAVADLSKPIKPFLWQDREDVRFDALDRPTDNPTFTRNEYQYGVTWRGRVWPSFWQCMVGSAG